MFHRQLWSYLFWQPKLQCVGTQSSILPWTRRYRCNAYQVHSICCKKLHNCVLCNRLKNGQDNPDFLIFQFRGAFKKFFKTRDEKELERRWTRINRNGPTHLGCVQAPASSQIRGSFVKNKYRKSSARFLKIMKNPEYSSRNEWSNPNCIDCKFW